MDGMPFEQEQEIRPCLMLNRYLAPGSFPKKCWYPKCDEQDKKALMQLYQTIGQKFDCGRFQDACCWGVNLFEVSPVDWPGHNGLLSLWNPNMD